MQEHTFHQPYPQSISIPAAAPGPTCPFCGAAGHTLGTVCRRCRVASPSPLSEISIAELLKRKARKSKQSKKRSAPSDYIPQTDGLHDPVPDQESGELDHYADVLDRLAVTVDDEEDADALPPTSAEIEALPWA